MVISMVVLSGCSNDDNGGNVDGNNVIDDNIVDNDVVFDDFDSDTSFLTSDVLDLTNGELLALMLEHPTALSMLLDLADEILEIDGSTGPIEDEAELLRIAEVATLRADAGFVIFNESLRTAYIEYLAMLGHGAELAEVPVTANDDLIARAGTVNITVSEFFDILEPRIGFAVALDAVDAVIMADYDVDPALVDAEIDALRAEGFEVTDELVASIERQLVETAILRVHRMPHEDNLRAMHTDHGGTAGASHIQVDSYDLAVEMITRLSEVSAGEFDELFAELALEYSDCSSAADGGDIGTWARGAMVIEFDDAVFDELAVGEFTLEPVQTIFGYHIIYKTFEAEELSFEEAREDFVDSFMQILRSQGAFNEVIMDLRGRVDINFSNDQLQERLEELID